MSLVGIWLSGLASAAGLMVVVWVARVNRERQLQQVRAQLSEAHRGFEHDPRPLRRIIESVKQRFQHHRDSDPLAFGDDLPTYLFLSGR